MLAAVSLIVWVVEAQFPAFVPIPGVKLGLSNAVTLFALYMVSPGSAICVFAIRVILGGLLSGNIIATVYGLCGGVLALTLALVLRKRFAPNQVWVLSALMAILHNCGQIVVAVWLTGASELFYYLPVLIISGVVTGSLTGLLVGILVKRMEGVVKL
jgi:heptaprenyl diphosphate synthase